MRARQCLARDQPTPETGQNEKALSFWQKVLEEDPENGAAISGISLIKGPLLGKI